MGGFGPRARVPDRLDFMMPDEEVESAAPHPGGAGALIGGAIGLLFGLLVMVTVVVAAGMETADGALSGAMGATLVGAALGAAVTTLRSKVGPRLRGSYLAAGTLGAVYAVTVVVTLMLALYAATDGTIPLVDWATQWLLGSAPIAAIGFGLGAALHRITLDPRLKLGSAPGPIDLPEDEDAVVQRITRTSQKRPG